MNLLKFDDKCVQIKCVDGKTYEGICFYNSRDYCFHEFGRDEDCLQIMYTLFYQRDIEKIRSLENHHGPYGRFTEKYGEIEKDAILDGLYFIEDIFEREENEHIYRLLLCLEDNGLNPEIIKLLEKLIKYNDDDKIIKKAKELINRESK